MDCYASLESTIQRCIAVSYTHLDVYKRQVYNEAMKISSIPYVQRFIADGEPHAFIVCLLYTSCVAVDFASLRHNWLNVGPIVFSKYTTVNNAVTNTNISICLLYTSRCV